MIQPWQATCMQVYCNLVNSARNRDEAMTIINRSLDRWVTLIRGTARGGGRQLLLFPDENHWVLKPHNSILWHDTVNAWLKRWTDGPTP